MAEPVVTITDMVTGGGAVGGGYFVLKLLADTLRDALAKRRNGNEGHGVEFHMRELAACQERMADTQQQTAHLLDKLLDRVDREIIPQVQATKHAVANQAQGLALLADELRGRT